MIYFILFFLEVAMLFLLSRKITKTLSRFLSINFLSFLFLPGVIVHELSHLLMAVILFVPVGNMEFIPKKSGNGIKLGSVEIGKTDPIRRSIIGFAPVFAGIGIIVGVIYFIMDNNPIVQIIEPNRLLGIPIGFLLFYFLFAVSNTMFSSKRDLEGTLEITITLLIIFATSYILGFRLPLDFIKNLPTRELIEIIKKSTFFLFVPIIVDLLILGAIRILRRN